MQGPEWRHRGRERVRSEAAGVPGRGRRRTGAGISLAVAVVLAVIGSGCGRPQAPGTDLPQHVVSTTLTPKPSPSVVATPTLTPTPKPVGSTPAPEITADANPLTQVPITVWCMVSFPSDWTVSSPTDGAYVAEGSNPLLTANFQVVGPSTGCPSEPASVENRGEGITIDDRITLTINGGSVTAWFTSGADPTYQNVDADVVVGTSCVDVGGLELGVASSANRTMLENIMESVQPHSQRGPSRGREASFRLRRGWSRRPRLGARPAAG